MGCACVAQRVFLRNAYWHAHWHAYTGILAAVYSRIHLRTHLRRRRVPAKFACAARPCKR
eukprot:5149387-Pleurochrysis_carterae.AAC.1